MSAETLRTAAELMRARAEAATQGPWVDKSGPGGDLYSEDGSWIADVATRDDLCHITSWHPDVALAVADWLEDQATYETKYMGPMDGSPVAALAVAHAYLGGAA